MAQLALILGNGFDIDMGIPSRYSDFIRSKEWKDAVAGFHMTLLDKQYHKISLIAHLQKASGNCQWFDIEQEIHKFVVAHPDNSERDIRDIRNEFEAIKKALCKYLKRISETFKADENRLAYQLLLTLQQSPLSVTEMYFNYTNPHGFLKNPLYYDPGTCTFTDVHGSLRENDIVLGCDLQEGEKVNRQLSFMYKYNQLKKANHVARNILEAKEIIFFGHSINEMDFCYFREFFKVASASPNPIRHLTIITYDEESERNIKDNIRNQGISVTDLYSNLRTFEFIYTSKLYDNDEKENRKWKEMIDRINREPNNTGNNDEEGWE